MKTRLAAALVLLACGCGPGWQGKYAATGTWDLSGPLGGGRTVGDSVADLLVEQIISQIGVPSPLEDKATEALDSAIRAPVKAAVDPRAPPELQPGGAIYVPLAATLAKVNVESEIELKPGLKPGSVGGSETFTAFAVEYQGKPYRLDASELSKVNAKIAAPWSGKEATAGELEVEPHEVSLEFGKTVEWVVGLLIDAAGQSSLKDKVKSSVVCDAIAAKISPTGAGLTVSVPGFSHTVSTAELVSMCNTALPLLEERALGLIKKGSTVELGGQVEVPGAELKSKEGFGGLIALAPRPIAPRVLVQFTAKRK